MTELAPTEPTPKRPRVTLACKQCRDRKTRCDGRQPICAACEKRGAGSTCTFDSTPRKQRRAEKSNSAEKKGTDRASLPVENASRSSANPTFTPIANRSEVPPTALQQPSKAVSQSPETHHDVDAMAAAPSYGRADERYDPSSTMPHFYQVDPETSKPPKHAGPLPATSRHRAPVLTLEPFDGATLPIRRNADEYVRCYWEFMDPVFPILERADFSRKYEALWASASKDIQGNRREEILFLSTLNLVFAIGVRFCDMYSAEQREEMADGFYKQSCLPNLFDILDVPSLSALRMLLMRAVYLQSTPFVTRCWYTVGLAVQTAQVLRLHTEAANSSRFSPEEVEMRRRLWHNCVTLDRLCAMGLGRPTVVSSSAGVPLPTMEKAPSLSLLSCRLSEILHDIVKVFYPAISNEEESHGSGEESILDNTMRLNRRLDRFEASIPVELRPVSVVNGAASDKFSPVSLQRQVLNSWLLCIRILSLRPILSHSIRNEPKDRSTPISESIVFTLDDTLTRLACEKCVDAAEQLIETLHASVDTPYQSTAWHVVYFTVSAATVFLVSKKYSLLNHQNRSKRYANSWQQCMAILRHHSIRMDIAIRAVSVLQAMKSRLDRGDSRNASTDDAASNGPSVSGSNTVQWANGGGTGTDGICDPNVSIDWLDQCLADWSWPLDFLNGDTGLPVSTGRQA